MRQNNTHLKLLALTLFMSIGSSSWGGNINIQSPPTTLPTSKATEIKVSKQPQTDDIFNMLYWIKSAADKGEPQAETFLKQAKKYGWLGLSSPQDQQPERKNW